MRTVLKPSNEVLAGPRLMFALDALQRRFQSFDQFGARRMLR